MQWLPQTNQFGLQTGAHIFHFTFYSSCLIAEFNMHIDKKIDSMTIADVSLALILDQLANPIHSSNNP